MNAPFQIKYSLFGSDRFALLMLLLFPITLLNVLFQSFVPYHLYLSGAYFIGLMIFIFYYYPKTTLTLTFMVKDFYEDTWKQYPFKVKWGDRLTWMHYVHPQIESFHIEGHYVDQACEHRVDSKIVRFIQQDMIVFTKWNEDNHQATFILDDNNQFMATGCNDFGQLGNGALVSTLKPIRIDFNLLKENEKIVKYWLGFSYVGFLLTNFGRVLVWGRNYFGEIGTIAIYPLFKRNVFSLVKKKRSLI